MILESKEEGHGEYTQKKNQHKDQVSSCNWEKSTDFLRSLTECVSGRKGGAFTSRLLYPIGQELPCWVWAFPYCLATVYSWVLDGSYGSRNLSVSKTIGQEERCSQRGPGVSLCLDISAKISQSQSRTGQHGRGHTWDEAERCAQEVSSAIWGYHLHPLATPINLPLTSQ